MYNPDSQEPVQIEAELEWKSSRGVSIKIWDGSMKPHPTRRGEKIRHSVFLPVSQINDGDFDPDEHEIGARLKIEIPNWLALREGLV